MVARLDLRERPGAFREPARRCPVAGASGQPEVRTGELDRRSGGSQQQVRAEDAVAQAGQFGAPGLPVGGVEQDELEAAAPGVRRVGIDALGCALELARAAGGVPPVRER